MSEPTLPLRYDPRIDGADCDHCPVRRWAGTDWRPVPGARRRRAAPKGLILGEAPAKAEERQGAPFRGQSGIELDAALRDCGIIRDEYDVDNVVACRAPENKYDAFAARLKKDQDDGRALPHEQHPSVHCRPRLNRTLARTTNIIPMGAKAASAVLGGTASILAIRGGPLRRLRSPDGNFNLDPGVGKRTQDEATWTPYKILPTVHPAFVRRARRWRVVFRADLRRAVRFFNDALQWPAPTLYLNPTPDLVRWFLAQPSSYWVYDLETTRIGGWPAPLLVDILCVGIARAATPAEKAASGSDIAAICVPLCSCETGRPWGEHAGIPGLEQAYEEILFGPLLRVDQPAHPPRFDETDAYTTAPWQPRVGGVGLPGWRRAWHRAGGVFTDGRLWASWFGGWFDKLVLWTRYGIVPRPHRDGILYHRNVASELSHALGVVGSIYLDIGEWKQNNEGEEIRLDARDDRELGVYCAAGDCAATYALMPILGRGVRDRKQNDPCPARPSIGLTDLDHRVQEACAGMSRTGLGIDFDRQVVEETRLRAAAGGRAAALIAALPPRIYNPNFNPNSVPQVRNLLYSAKGLGLTPEVFTESGDPSTGDAVLREFLMDKSLPAEARCVITILRDHRTFARDLSVVAKLIPRARGGYVDPDGRLRVGWSSHVPASGRVASSRPTNVQNLKKWMRILVIAGPGHLLIGSDYDALEGKLQASLWNLTRYLEAFARGQDTHQLSMEFALGQRIWGLPGAPPPQCHYMKKWPAGPWGPAGEIGGRFDDERTLAKRFYFGLAYGALARTILRLLHEAEEDDPTTGETRFPYAHLTEEAVDVMRRRFLTACPEMERGWDAAVARYKHFGFNWEKLGGRRRDFLDGADNDIDEFRSEVINHEIQCILGDVRVLTEHGYVQIRELVGRNFLAWTGKRWAPATAIEKGMAEVHQVRLDRGTVLRCDGSHGLLVPHIHEYGWMSVEELKGPQGYGTRRRVALDMARPLPFGAAVDPEDAYVLGFWLANGAATRQSDYEVALSFCVGDAHQTGPVTRSGPVQVERLRAWARSRGMAPATARGTGCSTVRVYLGGADWLLGWGVDPDWRAHSKRIPESIWRADLEGRKAFLRGFLDGDGHVTPHGGVGVNLCQRRLLQELWLLARTVGIDGTVRGPYKTTGKAGTDTTYTAYQLHLNGAQSWQELQWGRECRLRTGGGGNTPTFEGQRVQDRLVPTCQSDRVIKSRVHARMGVTSPYVLRRMGVDDVYDHGKIRSISARRVRAPVYTLVVDDSEHRYVAEGVISKNSSAACVTNIATMDLLDAGVTSEFAGFGTGLVQQGHDALLVEVPESKADWTAETMRACMTQEYPSLCPGVKFTVSMKRGRSWKAVC